MQARVKPEGNGMTLTSSQARALDQIGRRQHGLGTRDQLLPIIGPDVLQRWITAGRIEVVYPAVYRFAGAPAAAHQALLAAVLAAGDGALASHRAAAWLWHLLPERALPVEPEITVPSRRRPRLPRVIVHRSLDLDSERPSRRMGIPVTNPLVTILHLGAVAGDELVEDAIDLGLVNRLFTIDGLDAVHHRFGRPGRNGAGTLRRILNERALGSDRPDGLLSPRMARLLRSFDLPHAVFQHEVWINGESYLIDFAYPEVRLAIEVDGYETHSSPRALQRDLRRQNDLVAAGWTILRFTWTDVVRRPAYVARRIRDQLDALAPGSAVGH
jgi:very-short-patch-repair endonuclease